jgi:pimeloyl-ACP methyl ester carboxylesterase
MRSTRGRLTRFLVGLLAVSGLVLILFYRGPGFGLLSLQGLLERAAPASTAPLPGDGTTSDGSGEGAEPIGRATEADLRGAQDLPEGAELLRLRLTATQDRGEPVRQTVDGNPLGLTVTVANETSADFDGTVSLRLPPTENERQVDCRVTVAAGETGGCEIAVATDGWAWQEGGRAASRTIDATLIGRLGGRPAREQASLSISVETRPVILVHGFISDAGTWSDWTGAGGFLAQAGIEGFAVGDGQFGVEAMDTGSSADPRRGGNTIEQNARILARYVEAVREARGAARVDVVAHSMGGLIVRRYVADGMPFLEGDGGGGAPVVAQMHLIGTPNGGSHCAVPLAAMGALLPMSAELTPGYVREVFNPSTRSTRGVPLFVWAGDPVRDYAALICTPLPTDAFVSVGSVAGALPDTVPFVLARIGQRHLAQTKAPDVFAGILPQLARAPGDFPIAMPSGRPDLGGVRLAAEEDLQVVLAAAPGDGAAVQLGIGPATRASFALFGPGQPLGEMATAAEPLSAAPGLDEGALPAGAGDEENEDEENENEVPAEGVAAPLLAGRFEVGLPAGAEAWGAAAFIESTSRLRIEVAEPVVDPGATVNLRAIWSDAAEATRWVRVELLGPDGSVVAETELVDGGGFRSLLDGGNTFEGALTAPSTPGVYALVLHGSAALGSGVPGGDPDYRRVVATALTVRVASGE